MIRTAIIGCGKVADKHALHIARIPGVKLAAVCDVEPLMTQQMAERFNVEQQFNDVRRMFAEARPDVVHITTPPQTHFELGRLSLLAGCHAYIEKPFTINATEAEELIGLAIRQDRKLTVGHNAQFTPVMARMRQLVNEGYLGGCPVHMESVFCYETGGDVGYAKAFLGDSGHWLRQLPGSLLQNIISHGIGKMVEFLKGERPQVIAQGFTSPVLKRLGQHGIIDELRVIVRDEEDRTAYFTFSTQIQPSLHQFRVFGPRKSLIADDDNQVLIKLNANEYKSYVPYFVGPVQVGCQYFENLARNTWGFLKGDFHLPPDTGLMRLMEKFYSSISAGGPLPIPYCDILLTSRIMDDIFAQVLTNSGDGLGSNADVTEGEDCVAAGKETCRLAPRSLHVASPCGSLQAFGDRNERE
jgi:predicted dehydrogenase